MFHFSKFNKFILGVSLVVSTAAFSAQGTMITLEGKIRSFDKDSITLTTKNGSQVVVPRNLIPADVKLKSGEMARIPMLESDLAKLK